MQSVFIFNANRCVGCNACSIGCQIENPTSSNLLWRNVHSYNRIKHPALDFFHISMACNHCASAPCLSSCPAKAYTRDEITNVVIHHQEKCIGCRYCTWICPFDAPKYYPLEGVVKKCTFCNDQLKENLEPACVMACPTGALTFEFNDILPTNNSMTGFYEKCQPKLKIIEKRKKMKAKATVTPRDRKIIAKSEHKLQSKISSEKDWTLLVFTLIAPILTGAFAASVVGSITIIPSLFITLLCCLFVGSFLHLGNKKRFARSVLGFQNSWLSREIVFFAAFAVLSTIALFVYMPIYILITTALFGFAFVFSIDMVYGKLKKITKFNIHSSSALLSSALYLSIFIKNFPVFWVLLVIKLSLYTYRMAENRESQKYREIVIPMSKLFLSGVIPMFLWVVNPEYGYGMLIISIIAGEIIDRAEFYFELETTTPESKIQTEFLDEL